MLIGEEQREKNLMIQRRKRKEEIQKQHLRETEEAQGAGPALTKSPEVHQVGRHDGTPRLLRVCEPVDLSPDGFC